MNKAFANYLVELRGKKWRMSIVQTVSFIPVK